MYPNPYLDAQSAYSFLVQQASVIEAEVYRTRYPDFEFGEIVPVDSSAPAWTKSVTFFSLDSAGQAEWISGNAFNIPLADVVRSKGEHQMHMAGIGYEWNIEELNTARMLGMNLPTEKAFAARRAYMQFMYSLALSGDTDKNLTGIFNASGMTGGNVAADGTGSSMLWADKTPAQIIRDISDLLIGPYVDSLTVEMVDTLLLPITALQYIAQTPMSTANGDTILSFLRLNNPVTQISGRALTIRAVRGLENAGGSSTGRMIAYRRDPSVLKLHLPMPHMFLPVWQNGPMHFQNPGIFRTGGLEVRLPGAMRYADGFIA